MAILTIVEYSGDNVEIVEKELVVNIADFDTGVGALPLSTFTALGTLAVGTSANNADGLVVGSDGEILIADSTQATGIRWGKPGSLFKASDSYTIGWGGGGSGFEGILEDSYPDILYIDPSGSARNIVLPEEGTGNHAFFIVNTADADEVITVKDDADNVIGSLGRYEANVFMSNGVSWRGLKDTPEATPAEVMTGTNVYKTLTPFGIVGSHLPLRNGWIKITSAFTYVSDNVFTMPTDNGEFGDLLQPGDILCVTQSAAVKYFVVVSNSMTGPTTTITVTGGTNYTYVNAAITLPYLKKATPIGEPINFQWNGASGINAQGFESLASNACNVTVRGRLAIVRFNIAGVSNATTLSGTLPIAPNALDITPLRAKDNTTAFTWGNATLAAGSTTVNFYTNANVGAWTNVNTKSIMGTIIYAF